MAAVLLVKSPPGSLQFETVDTEQVERVLEDLHMLRELPLVPPSQPEGGQVM
jgi:hypothetical protein